MRKTHSIETFKDPFARVTETQDDLTGLTKITVEYGERDELNQPIEPKDNHGLWIALLEDNTYYVFYWKRAPYEGGDIEINDLSHLEEGLREKKKIIEQSKELEISNDWGHSIHAYNDLMKKWKTLPHWHMSFEDEFWNQFQQAQSHFFERLREDHNANKEKKLELIEKAKSLSESEEWKSATAQLQNLLAQWKQIGSAGREEDDKLWETFHQLNDTFYQRKNAYWQSLQPAYEEAKAQKQALIEKVRTLKDSEAWKETSEKMKMLMDEWKKTGFAGKENNDLWNEFNNLRQEFYTRRTKYFESLDAMHKENYEAKKKLVDEAHRIAHSLDFSRDSTFRMKSLQKEWKEIGNAGRDKENKLWEEFKQELDLYFDNLRQYGSYN